MVIWTLKHWMNSSLDEHYIHQVFCAGFCDNMGGSPELERKKNNNKDLTINATK